MVQGVREVFEIFDSPKQRDAGAGATKEASDGKLVLIGRQIQGLDFQQSLLIALGRAK